MEFNFVGNTDGSGFWSNAKREIHITKLVLAYVADDGKFGELRAYFTPKSWDINRHGLIYTDPTFMREFRAALTCAGMPGEEVSYSEQGMQGDDYVSMDVDEKFINAWYNPDNKVTDKDKTS